MALSMLAVVPEGALREFQQFSKIPGNESAPQITI